MARRFDSPALVIASHNEGKVREIRDLLAPYRVTVTSAGGMGLAEPVEDGHSFAANAEIKARAIAAGSGLPSLADDSGLVVDALGGAPGIYSARWAGRERDFGRAMERVEAGLAGQRDRSAAFVCVLALAWPDGGLESFEGRIEGSLVWPPRGSRGFGYDPIFLPEGGFETFGEMAPRAKHAISHRARAFRKLVAGCFGGTAPAGRTD
jgi:XTP/dITP diphosphohydrolase